MRKPPWWRSGWLWAGILTGLFFATLAVASAVFLNWRPEARLWLGGAGFCAGAAFEWFRLGARRFAGLAAVTGFAGAVWFNFPEESRPRVDWLAPVRMVAPAVERVPVEEIVLPDPPAAERATRTERGRGQSPAPTRIARFTIEVHNAEDDALELTYSAGTAPRALGRIPGGAIQRLSIELAAGTTIQLIATSADTSAGARMSYSIQLDDPTELKQVTLRRR
jgi:hypothetical protein